MGEVRRVVEESFRYIEKGDLDGFAALMSDDCEFQSAGTVLRGPQEIKAWQQVFSDAFPNPRITFDNVIESGDTVVSEVQYAGTHTGSLQAPTGAIPATGREINVHGCSIDRVKGGKIVSTHVYFDMTELLGQLGLLPT